MKKILILLSPLLLCSCFMYTEPEPNSYSVSVDALSDPNIDVSQYNLCFFDESIDKRKIPEKEAFIFVEEDMLVRQFINIMKQNLSYYGFRFTNNRSEANCVIHMMAGISKPQTREVNIPLFGPTGINSITKNTSTTYGATGNAVAFGNSLYSNIEGSGSSTSTYNVNQSYGITGFMPITVTTYLRFIGLTARASNKKLLWRVFAVSSGTNFDIRALFPYMSVAIAPYAGKDTFGFKEIKIYEDVFTYNYYIFNEKIYRFNPNQNIYEIYSSNKTWRKLPDDNISQHILDVKNKGVKVPFSYIMKYTN